MLEELEYAIAIIYIGGIPLEHFGVKWIIYIYFFKSFSNSDAGFWDFLSCVVIQMCIV